MLPKHKNIGTFENKNCFCGNIVDVFFYYFGTEDNMNKVDTLIFIFVGIVTQTYLAISLEFRRTTLISNT